MFQLKDKKLESIREKVSSGQRVSREEGLDLFRTRDVLGLGWIANAVKEKKTGNRVTYVVNRQINPTNICILSCRFCDFGTKKNRANAYQMSLDEILSKCSPDLREVHIVGGLHHEWPFAHYVNIVRTIHESFPGIQIKAYTAVEIDFFARMEKCGIDEVLSALKEAGLVCLPGGGAEGFSEPGPKAPYPF